MTPSDQRPQKCSLFWRERKGVKPCLCSKGIEFGAFKIGIVKLLPNTKILNGGAIANPILNDIVRPFRIPIPCHIRKTYIIFLIAFEHNRDFCGFYYYNFLAHSLLITSATVSCLYNVTLRGTTSAAELNIFRESVTNHNANVVRNYGYTK